MTRVTGVGEAHVQGRYARLEAELHAHLVHDEQARDLPDALLHRDEASERRHVSGVNPLAKTGIARIIQQRRFRISQADLRSLLPPVPQGRSQRMASQASKDNQSVLEKTYNT